MGHDIHAYHGTDKEQETELAYLRRSAFDEGKKQVYEALGALEFYGGVSGTGGGKIFNKSEIKAAMNILLTKDDAARELTFLSECLDNLDENGQVYIYFS